MITMIRHRTRPTATLLADWTSLCSWLPRVGVQGSRPTWFTRVTGVQLDPAQEEKHARIENKCGERSIKGGKKNLLPRGFEHGPRGVWRSLKTTTLDICHFPRDGSFSRAPRLNLPATASLIHQFYHSYKYKS